MRHFFVPVYTFTHPKEGTTRDVAIVNRKRGMPSKLWAYEGLLSLFGGGAEPGEGRVDTLLREGGEELAALDFSAADLGDDNAVFVAPPDALFAFTVTGIDCGAWTQAECQRLSATCEEGVLDWVALRDDFFAPALWADRYMAEAVKALLERRSAAR